MNPPLSTDQPAVVPRPAHWPHRADPPGRYWGNYELYQRRGGLVRLEDDIRSLTGGKEAYGDVSRFYFFCLAFDQMMKEEIKGDIAELGTYRGETATVLAAMARRMGVTAWLLDTFEGFNPVDLQGVDAGHRMEFADTSLEAVRALVGEQNVRYVKGHFPGSASQMPDDLSFSLVHIDCDLYVPIAHALRYFYPRLVPGGYLIVHDYAALAWDGAEQAVDEFFLDKPEAIIPLTDGCGSAVIRKAQVPGERAMRQRQARCALFTQAWSSAGKDALRAILGSGWSGAEDWGVWGVGPSHVLNLPMAERPTGDVLVEIDAGSALVGSRLTQDIDVFAGGQQLATLHFSATKARTQSVVRAPVGAVIMGNAGILELPLEFRPRSVARVVDLDPSRGDIRALGLALFGIRRADAA